ncbi:putative pyruvyl transferase EpsI [Vallitalea longa]|uniref:Pyruvyl transferase EpsI n=1 Tax=Vallitalea longa TaxID=2936439 RepID=A0A9W6DHN7_9FIRM|nr:polysaccharide pyruvyl transferase family protein [Vallitalea longa]GKX31757.1 putative pyruvyl transferase EpsI [Vallitalea longa]
MWNHIKIIKKIKSILPSELKLILIRIIVATQYIKYTLFPKKVQNIDKKKKTIFILLSTDYSNLGDHAMTYAHIKYIRENNSDTQVVEILVNDTLKYLKYLLSIIKPDDILTLKGGGNVGLEYFREELYRRILLKKFNKNKIVMFPQTVYFPNTSKGKREFVNTINVFTNHSQFYAFFRDRTSFDLVKNYLNNKVFLVPDITLSLGNLGIKNDRIGVTICLRSDKEGILTNKHKQMVINCCKNQFEHINITDTITDYQISIKERENELNKIWNTFSSSRLIVTDRLHGMIFAAITATPCIVFSNYNHKLIDQYKWLEHLNYIKFIKCEKKEIYSAIQQLNNIKVIPYNAEIYSDLYSKINEIIIK